MWQTDECDVFDLFEDDVVMRKQIQAKTKKKTKKNVANNRKKNKKLMKIAKKKKKKKKKGGGHGGGALGFDPERIAKLRMALSRQQKLKSAAIGR